jgi:hypothetical protein
MTSGRCRLEKPGCIFSIGRTGTVQRIVVCLAAVTIFLCEGPDGGRECTTLDDPQKGIQLIYPRGLETFEMGSIVTVKWKMDPSIIRQVGVWVSTAGVNGPWKNICAPIDIMYGREIRCMDTIWIIGEEYETVPYAASGTVHLRIGQYNDDVHSDISGMITVNSRPAGG